MYERMGHELAAYDLGVQQAINAASWIIDGNTKREFIPTVLALMDDGDPRADEYLPRRPDLSGEFADDLTPLRLATTILGDSVDPDPLIDGLCEAFEQGVDDTFEQECERILREAVA